MVQKGLLTFAEIAQGFIDSDRLKLILFAAGVKPATYIALKIDSSNLGEKYRFEQHLKDLVFVASKARSFEEIEKIEKNKIHWNFKGVWIGYDLFNCYHGLKQFKEYITNVRKRNHEKADRIAGKLYGYPECCVENFIKEHNTNYLKEKYTCYEYYKRLYDSVRRFPFVFHTPCSKNCTATAKLNNTYKHTLKKIAPKFYKEFTRKKILKTELIVDAESDVFDKTGNTIWPSKDGHEYSTIAKTPFQGHHYLYAYLTKNCYERGTVLDAKVKMRYNYADIKAYKTKEIIKNLIHLRKFQILGRKF
ncbi:MAG: DUF483 domain-containing protein [Candidatus Woesearchaeota archaeon]